MLCKMSCVQCECWRLSAVYELTVEWSSDPVLYGALWGLYHSASDLKKIVDDWSRTFPTVEKYRENIVKHLQWNHHYSVLHFSRVNLLLLVLSDTKILGIEIPQSHSDYRLHRGVKIRTAFFLWKWSNFGRSEQLPSVSFKLAQEGEAFSVCTIAKMLLYFFYFRLLCCGHCPSRSTQHSPPWNADLHQLPRSAQSQ